MLAEGEKPVLTFDMLQPTIRGQVMAVRAFKDIFGPENYDLFWEAGKKNEYIPEEDKQRVDRLVYGKIAAMLGVSQEKGEATWRQAIALSNSTINYAREKLFADQERKASLTTNIARVRRPSSALEILTTPTKFMGEQCKYEQGRQLALAIPAAEIINRGENGGAEEVMDELERVLETQFFVGRRADPQDYLVYSYHAPYSNRLVGLRNEFPTPTLSDKLWVKSLTYPVRTVGLRATLDWQRFPVLYDPREKELESAVIKALNRSKKANKIHSNGSGLVETSPYGEDRLGFRLVVMDGGREARDVVMNDLEALLQTLGREVKIKPDDQVNEQNGRTDRVEFRRKQVKVLGLKQPIEVIVQDLADYVSYQYEVGEFDPELGMHNGQAHDLYKLARVAEVADDLWPEKVFDLDLTQAKESASFEYATRLGRIQRIHPNSYPGLVA